MQKGFWHLLQFRTCLEVLAQTCLTRSFGSDLQALDPPYLLLKRLCLLMSFCFGFCLPTVLATLDRCIESPALATEVTDPGKACLLQRPSTLVHCVDDALSSPPTITAQARMSSQGPGLLQGWSDSLTLFRTARIKVPQQQHKHLVILATVRISWFEGCGPVLILGGTFFRNAWYCRVQGWDGMRWSQICTAWLWPWRRAQWLDVKPRQ